MLALALVVTCLGACRTKPAPNASSAPTPPVAVAGHDYLGSFTVADKGLVAGDPSYVHASSDVPVRSDSRENVLVPDAAPGEWLAFVRRDREDPSRASALVAVHASASSRIEALRKQTKKVASLWVDGGQMAILDATVRDDERYEDAMHFRSDPEGLVEGRGCLSQSGDGDGTYPATTASENGRVVLVVVEF